MADIVRIDGDEFVVDGIPMELGPCEQCGCKLHRHAWVDMTEAAYVEYCSNIELIQGGPSD